MFLLRMTHSDLKSFVVYVVEAGFCALRVARNVAEDDEAGVGIGRASVLSIGGPACGAGALSMLVGRFSLRTSLSSV